MSNENPVSRLNQKCIDLFGWPIRSKVKSSFGLPHDKTFVIQILLPVGHVVEGEGKSKSEAKRNAALKGLLYLQGRGLNPLIKDILKL